MLSSDDIGKKISQLHQELVNDYKKRFMCENGQIAVVKCSPTWKSIRKHSLSVNLKFILKQKHGNRKLSLLQLVKAPFYFYGKTVQGKVSEFQMR